MLRRRTQLRRSTKHIRTRRPLGIVRREAKAAGDLTPEQWEAICLFYGGRCAYCDRCVLWPPMEQDHVMPLSKGGRHCASNIVLCCCECNRKKGTSTRWQPRRRHPFMEEK